MCSLTRLARSTLSLKGKKASELRATACKELFQLVLSVSDRGSGTSSNMAFHTARSGPWGDTRGYSDTHTQYSFASESWLCAGFRGTQASGGTDRKSVV